MRECITIGDIATVIGNNAIALKTLARVIGEMGSGATDYELTQSEYKVLCISVDELTKIRDLLKPPGDSHENKSS